MHSFKLLKIFDIMKPDYLPYHTERRCCETGEGLPHMPTFAEKAAPLTSPTKAIIKYSAFTLLCY